MLVAVKDALCTDDEVKFVVDEEQLVVEADVVLVPAEAEVELDCVVEVSVAVSEMLVEITVVEVALVPNPVLTTVT